VSRPDEQRVDDILALADELAAIVASGVERFRAESVLRRAAERLLELIGEAATAVSPGMRAEVPDIAWSDITRLRIVLAHHYHRVDPEQVWVIASEYVPGFAAALRHR
jgi:uncharacterized protein with HEPN domain